MLRKYPLWTNPTGQTSRLCKRSTTRAALENSASSASMHAPSCSPAELSPQLSAQKQMECPPFSSFGKLQQSILITKAFVVTRCSQETLRSNCHLFSTSGYSSALCLQVKINVTTIPSETFFSMEFAKPKSSQASPSISIFTVSSPHYWVQLKANMSLYSTVVLHLQKQKKS